MFAKVAAFELRYQLRSALFWITFLIFFLLTFGAIVSDNVRIGSGGNVKVNAPFAIAEMMMIMGVFAVFIMTAFVANVIVRDDETGFGAIVQSTRVSKFDYLFGRFSGAFAAGCLVFASVPLAMLIGATMPWLDPDTVGPLRPGHYLYVYLVLCLPTLFVTGAGFFALATATRSMLATYVGVIVFLVLYFVATAFFDKPQFEKPVGLIEPFGLGALAVTTKYWTAADRNTQLPQLAGMLLWNRVLWSGIALALLGVAYAVYGRTRGRKRGPAATDALTAAEDSAVRPQATTTAAPDGTGRAAPAGATGVRGTAWSQLAALTRFDMSAVFRSPAFVVLLGIGFVNAIGALWYADERYDNTIHPVTRVMIETLTGSFTIMPLIIAIYYAGELVWRDRERRIHEIVDASPAPDWTFVLPKILAIAVVLLATLVVSVLAAIAVQALKGYQPFEIGKYALWYVLPFTLTSVSYAALAVLIQTLVPQKFVGWLIMLLVIVAQITFDKLGLENNLYQFASGPPVPLSDMNGQGDFAQHRAWYRAYWIAISVVLVVFSHWLWRRGASAPLVARLKRLPGRVRGASAVVAALAALTAIGLGVFIHYNVKVLNEYVTANEVDRRTAEYEKLLLAYEKLPQPRITDVVLAVDVHPHEPRVVTTGHYVVENRTDAPIGEIHLRWMPELRMELLEVDGGSVQRDLPAQRYRIFALDTPMAPGERREIRFQTVREQHGFRNSNNETRIVDNGTFVNNFEIAPMLGMGREQLLRDRVKRRKYGLQAELRPPKLEDDSAREFNYLRRDSDWVNADLTVSTVADQLVVAPGYLVRETVADGRRTAQYRTDAPIQHFFSIQSAAYSVQRDRWNDVDLAVYYDPAHPYNVEQMIDGMKSSLAYFSEHFSPYQFRQARILEFPEYEVFAQAFANTIPYSEGIGFIANHVDPEKIDMVTYVTAHEIAHQWWAHQIIGAEMQGMTLLSETLAQYSALMVMEHEYGPDQIRRFLKFELDRYLRRRGGELIEELPLERVEDQPYLHYQKGALVMYLLKDQIGEQAVNRALQGLLKEFAFKGPPYPTSKDLLRYLRAEAPPEHQALITDLFQKITLYDVRIDEASSTRTADGRWDVEMQIEARKLYADGEGRETDAALDESFDIGVFTAEPGRKDFSKESVLSMQRAQLHSGRQTLRLSVDREPKFVGVDPYNKRVDRNSDDNLFEIE